MFGGVGYTDHLLQKLFQALHLAAWVKRMFQALLYAGLEPCIVQRLHHALCRTAGARSAMAQAHVHVQYAKVMAFGAVILMSDFCNPMKRQSAWKILGTMCSHANRQRERLLRGKRRLLQMAFSPFSSLGLQQVESCEEICACFRSLFNLMSRFAADPFPSERAALSTRTMLLPLFAYVESALLHLVHHSVALLMRQIFMVVLCKVSVKLEVRACEKRMHAIGLCVRCLPPAIRF